MLISEKGWSEVINNPTEQDLIKNWVNIPFENNRDIDKLNDQPLYWRRECEYYLYRFIIDNNDCKAMPAMRFIVREDVKDEGVGPKRMIPND